MKIHNPHALPETIILKAIQMMQDENPGRTIAEITVKPTAEPDEYSITPVFVKVPFERLRRITGYLSKLTNFNNAKQAEEGDRVTHGYIKNKEAARELTEMRK